MDICSLLLRDHLSRKKTSLPYMDHRLFFLQYDQRKLFAELDVKIRNRLIFYKELLHECFTLDVEALKAAESAPKRAQVVERVNQLGPPSQFRLIDCQSTWSQRRVVLVDGHLHQNDYTIISHTWGEASAVYGVFDCECACECSASAPRSSGKACPGHHDARHGEVVADMLNMCERLILKAGSKYVWHDGVCIAQHNEREVEETIRHMGWFYATATDTIIFLDYVGKPMALLVPHDPYVTRWNKRVWTLQEAMLSRRRRYCIRMVSFLPVETTTLANFEAQFAHSYEDDTWIEVVEEDEFWVYLVLLSYYVWEYFFEDLEVSDKRLRWATCLESWILILKDQCFGFPNLSTVLKQCAHHRESKHKGDRINSVLALAGITDFVAPKEGNLEASSIQFFKRLNGQDVILEVLFWVDCWEPEHLDTKRHTWLPSMSTGSALTNASLKKVEHSMQHETQFKSWMTRLWRVRPVTTSSPGPPPPTRGVVMQNGMLELRGHLLSVAVEFTFQNPEYNSELPSLKKQLTSTYINNGMLLMDVHVVFHDVCGCYTSFAKASSTKLGHAVLQHGLSVLRPNPIIQGEVMNVGIRCLAHLVFPSDLVLQISEGERRANELAISCWDAALIVAGNLQNPVCKLGHFMADSILTSLIIENLLPFTVLDRLVIV